MRNNGKILASLIADVFVNEQDQILNKLVEHQFDECITEVLNTIDQVDNLDSLSQNSFISSLSSSFLTNINTKIFKLEDPIEKEKLQYIIGELSKQILIRLMERSNSPAHQVLEQITSSLKVACKINNWNFEVLSRRMSFELLHIITAKSDYKSEDSNNTSLEKSVFYFYEWTGENEFDLSELAYILKDRKIIKSTKEFKRLFQKHNKNLTIRFNAEHIDFIIILFDELNRKRLIRAKGPKAKHFTPLKAYAVDFGKVVLIKTEPKHLNHRIKKNEKNYRLLKENIDKWIKNYKPKS